jgi:hypothetical protein
MMGELQTALFSPWVVQLVPPCELCAFDACEERWTLTNRGEFRVGTDDAGDTWASWPECPRRFEAQYAMGLGVGTIRDAVAWSMERGEHRHANLTAGAAQICRYYLERKDSPDHLREYLALPESAREGEQ